jgi:hypothetical protein
MIRYCKHKDIDFEKWDDCIQSSPNAVVYACSWYLNAVCGEWDALVEDDYIAVFPLPVKRKLGLPYAVQPAWIQQLGLFSKGLMNKKQSMDFLGFAMKKICYLQINLNSYQKHENKKGFRFKENNNFQLPLIFEYENIRQSYSDNLKRNLKKANEKLKYSLNFSHEEVIKMFRLHRGENIKVLRDEEYKRLSALVYAARAKGIAEIVGVTDEKNSMLAGAIFFKAFGKTIMIFSAVGDEGKEKKAMHYLIDRYIQENCQNNLILDFEGSNNQDLARFYKGFGAQNVPYCSVVSSRIPLLGWWRTR